MPFLLTPMRTGSLLVVIELIWEDAERGYRRLKTNCVAESEQAAAFAPLMNVVRMELGTSERGPSSVMAVAPAPAPVLAVNVEPLKKTPGFLASPLLKAGLAIFVVAIGSSLFLTRNVSKTGSTSMSSQSPETPASPPVIEAGSVLEDKLAGASVAFDRVERQGASRDVATAAAVQEGRQNLAAARFALAQGDRVEAKKRLAAADAQLARIQKVAAGRK